MKTIFTNFTKAFFLSLIVLALVVSCQKEETEIINPPEEETLVANSNLVNLMALTAKNDGSEDNSIDSANCIEVVLPVAVIVNGEEIIVNSEADYQLVELALNQLDNNNNTVEIIFPISIILTDYSQVTITNQNELDTYTSDCLGENEDDEDIECIDFQYPISISIYNTGFQLVDTAVISDDESLYYFIENLQSGVLASINFPVTMVLANGETLVVENNTELQVAITEADNTCDEDDDYDWNDEVCVIDLAVIEEYLLECNIVALLNDASGNIIDENQLNFNANGDVVVNGDSAVTESGTWSLSEVNLEYVLTIQGLSTFNLLNGEWLFLGCENDNLIFQQGTGNDAITMQLEQNCQTDCPQEIIFNDLTDCLWVVEEFSNNENNEVFTFNFEENNALYTFPTNVSVGVSWDMSVSNSGLPVIVITNLSNSFDGSWVVLECNNGSYVLDNGVDTMVIKKECNLLNEFLTECNSLYVDSQECDDDNDGFATFIFETNSNQSQDCIDLYPIELSSYSSYTDAFYGVNGIDLAVTTPLEFQSQTIYVRVYSFESHEYAIQELDIVVENCAGIFDCFTQMGYVKYGCDYNNDGSVEFYLDIYEESSNCEFITDFDISYYTSQEDANAGVNQIVVIDPFENTMNLTVAYARVSYVPTGEYQIYPIDLILSPNCPNFNCVEADIVSNFQICNWVITDYTNYNNSTDFSSYAITFNSNGTLIINSADGSEASGGNWNTQASGGYVYLTLSGTSITELSFFNDTFKFIECENGTHFEMEELTNFNNIMTLDQDCN